MAAVGQDPAPVARPERLQAHGTAFFCVSVVSDGREGSPEVGSGRTAVAAAEVVPAGEEEVEDDEGGDGEEDEEEGGDEDHDYGF